MRLRSFFLAAFAATLGLPACGPASEPATPPPASLTPAAVSVPVPPPPTTSAPVVKVPESKPPPPPELSDLATEQDMNDTAAHLRVPVGSSPVRGKATALVTVIMFGGYQDPFSFRALLTIQKLQQTYGDDLRLVWKDRPLAFHKMDVPMLLAAHEVREKQGDAGFWQAFDILFEEHDKLQKINQKNLPSKQGNKGPMTPSVPFDAPQFKDAARQLKISATKQKEMLATKANPASINEDMALGDEVRVHGTPTFFINGRRLVGAQPIEVFVRMIDEELEVAKEVVAGGVERSKVYETLQAKALKPRPRAPQAPGTPPAPSGAGMGPPMP